MASICWVLECAIPCPQSHAPLDVLRTSPTVARAPAVRASALVLTASVACCVRHDVAHLSDVVVACSC